MGNVEIVSFPNTCNILLAQFDSSKTEEIANAVAERLMSLHTNQFVGKNADPIAPAQVGAKTRHLMVIEEAETEIDMERRRSVKHIDSASSAR